MFTQTYIFQVLIKSKNYIIRDCFHTSELDNRKRPDTVRLIYLFVLLYVVVLFCCTTPFYLPPFLPC